MSEELKERMTADVAKIIQKECFGTDDDSLHDYHHDLCERAAIAIIKRIAEYADEDFGKEQ